MVGLTLPPTVEVGMISQFMTQTLAMTARTRTPLAVHSRFAQLQATCSVHSFTVAPESLACPPPSAIDGCDGLTLLSGRWQFGGGWALSGVRVHRPRTISGRLSDHFSALNAGPLYGPSVWLSVTFCGHGVGSVSQVRLAW